MYPGLNKIPSGVLIARRRFISGAVVALQGQGRSRFSVIFNIQYIEQINTLFSIHGKIIHIIVLNLSIFFIRDNILDSLAYHFILKIIYVYPYRIMLLLILLTGRREIFSKIKYLMHIFSLLKDYYLVLFDIFIMNIP